MLPFEVLFKRFKSKRLNITSPQNQFVLCRLFSMKTDTVSSCRHLRIILSDLLLYLYDIEWDSSGATLCSTYDIIKIMRLKSVSIYMRHRRQTATVIQL